MLKLSRTFLGLSLCGLTSIWVSTATAGARVSRVMQDFGDHGPRQRRERLLFLEADEA
jgi:hypothetical protein